MEVSTWLVSCIEEYFGRQRDADDSIAVSPWFSTHFPWKNWVFVCEQLITDRWEQMLTMQPELIQIASWNGASSSHFQSYHRSVDINC